MEGWITETHEIQRVVVRMESMWDMEEKASVIISKQLLFPDLAFAHQKLLAGQSCVLYFKNKRK